MNFPKLAKDLGPILCILIMVLDVAAGVLAIQAENAQNKVKHLRMWVLECRDPSYESFKLGLAASVLLILAHAIANIFGGCVCIWSKKELDEATANKQIAMGSLIFSWIVLAIAFSFLVIGTLANSKSRKSCGILHTHLLAIGGALCFFHGLFAVAFHVSVVAAEKEEKKHSQPQAVA